MITSLLFWHLFIIPRIKWIILLMYFLLYFIHNIHIYKTKFDLNIGKCVIEQATKGIDFYVY